MDKKLSSIYAAAVECLHQKIDSDESFIDSVQKIEIDDSDGVYLDVQLTVKVNHDVLSKTVSTTVAA